MDVRWVEVYWIMVGCLYVRIIYVSMRTYWESGQKYWHIYHDQLVIKLVEIHSIEKRKMLGMIQNAIMIQTKDTK